MTVSVIIPTYNEEATIAETIKIVKKHGGENICEIIVADGGSEDETVTKARSATANVFEAPYKGRAAQMNYGAKQAEGEILYFLHADSLPPEGYPSKILQAVEDGSEAGCFQLTFDRDHPLLNLYAWFTRFDIDAFRFGDQSLFVTRTAFQQIGGFREDHIVMEDNEIVRRIKDNFSFIILDDSVITSARKYEQVGVVKLQLVFTVIYTLYQLGIDQSELVKFYNKIIR